MRKESITLLAVDSEGTELDLEFEFFGDTVGILVDGTEVCGLNWTENLRPALERALELWPAVELTPGEGS